MSATSRTSSTDCASGLPISSVIRAASSSSRSRYSPAMVCISRARSAAGTVRQEVYSLAERATASRICSSVAVSKVLTVSPVAGLVVA